MADREQIVYRAKLAEEAERYEDMVKSVKELAQKSSGANLSVEERNLLSVAYKNVVGARRASWRVLTSIEAKEKERGEADRVKDIEEYRSKVEEELREICRELLEILDNYLIANDSTAEGRVFYLKMAGDYYRYLSEFATGEARDEKSKLAKERYEQASKAAEENGLPATNPIRLGLALNFSVFYYEILGQPQQACNLAKQAFDGAISELDSLEEDQYKDATLIMQLIRDNLTLWTTDTAEADEGNREKNEDGTNVVDIGN